MLSNNTEKCNITFSISRDKSQFKVELQSMYFSFCSGIQHSIFVVYDTSAFEVPVKSGQQLNYSMTIILPFLVFRCVLRKIHDSVRLECKFEIENIERIFCRK